jgi:hypothetical protein
MDNKINQQNFIGKFNYLIINVINVTLICKKLVIRTIIPFNTLLEILVCVYIHTPKKSILGF